MTEESVDLPAAMALWEPLAAFAWRQFLAHGPGVVLIEQASLRRGAQRVADRGVWQVDAASLDLGYVPLRAVLPGDDFLPVIRESDPHRQVALIVRDADGNEQLYILEPAGIDRPSPQECAAASGPPPPTG